jgi:hypothetical protein
MKYTKEITDKLILDYNSGIAVKDLAEELDVPERSIIAKLSSLGVYHKKQYVNKRGEVPIKKSAHIATIAELLGCDEELLESLEKVNKQVLKLIELKLTESTLN